MKNNMRKSITYKIFFITTILLIVSTISIYFIIYYMLPGYYLKYKSDDLINGINDLTGTVQSLTLDKSKKYFDSFTLKYNASIGLLDPNGNIAYVPTEFIKITNGVVPKEIVDKITSSKPIRIYINSANIKNDSPKVFSTSREIKFKEDPKVYTLYVNATLQPIGETSKVLIMFLPYVLLIILVVSVTGAFIYSRIISNPMIKINKIAKRMAGLNFSERCKIYGDDEIGELSKSLNELASNLEATMNELKSANAKLLNDIEKERKIEKNRREFVAVVSHELKTPITIIKGQMEGMISNIGVYKDRDKYLNRSLNVLQDMESMVREILDISKLESRGFKLDIEVVNFTALVDSCIDKLMYIANKKNIQIVKDIKWKCYTEIDGRLMSKAISNVINNSVMHSNANEKVYIRLFESEDNLILEVENTGTHIEDKEMSEIFKPFYRIEKSHSRNTGGSGLGLYIVKIILELHNIKYNISNTNKGVQFKMNFKKTYPDA